MLHKKLAENVMNLLLEGDTAILQELRKQYESARIVSIDDTGAGFYVNFEVSDFSLKLKLSLDDFNFGDVYGIYNGIFGAVGFVLFIRDGFISCLEGYNNVGSNWPSQDIGITLCYDTQGKREIPNILQEHEGTADYD